MVILDNNQISRVSSFKKLSINHLEDLDLSIIYYL